MNTEQKQPDNYLTLPAVRAKTGLGRTTIWRYEKEDKFPKRVYLGPRSPRWIEREIDEWLDACKRDREGRREQ